jgi:TonB family protein
MACLQQLRKRSLSANFFGVKTPPVAALFVLFATCLAGQANSTIYQVGGDVKAPRPISTSVPPPPESVHKQLTVRVSFVVMPDGSVANIRLIKRSKSDFDDYAIGVVSKLKFEPATKNGKPVAVRLETEMQSHR